MLFRSPVIAPTAVPAKWPPTVVKLRELRTALVLRSVTVSSFNEVPKTVIPARVGVWVITPIPVKCSRPYPLRS